jgi:hypothetical protein
MHTQTRDDPARCFCGAEITNASVSKHIQAARHGMEACRKSTFGGIEP